MNRFRKIFFVFLIIMNVAVFTHASPQSDNLVTEGRALLFGSGDMTYSGIIAGNDKFKAAVQADPGSDLANLFYGITRLPASFLQDGPDVNALDSFKELLEGFGCELVLGTSFGDLPYSCYEEAGEVTLPPNALDGRGLREFLTGPCLTILDGAISNMDAISGSFQLLLDDSETGFGSTLDVDYGDVLLFKSSLLMLKVFFQSIGAYNIDVDFNEIVEKLDMGLFQVQSDLFDLYPDFLKLLPTTGVSADGAAILEQAKQDMISSIDAYLAASDSIRNETDSQLDDVMYFDADDLGGEAHFRSVLQEVKDSLLVFRVAVLENNDGIEVGRIDLNHLFGNPSVDPMDIRGILPEFDSDDNILADSFPDPTLDGVLVSVPIDGSITYNGQSLCAMVLANGQYMFSCGGDFGSFDLVVPLDGNGEITLYGFTSGFSPFKTVLKPWEASGFDIIMSRAEEGSREMTIDFQTEPGTMNSDRTRIWGTVNYNGQKLCAMVLANGQNMFSCGSNLGTFDLEVPLDGNGEITLYVFCSGFAPYKNVFTP